MRFINTNIRINVVLRHSGKPTSPLDAVVVEDDEFTLSIALSFQAGRHRSVQGLRRLDFTSMPSNAVSTLSFLASQNLEIQRPRRSDVVAMPAKVSNSEPPRCSVIAAQAIPRRSWRISWTTSPEKLENVLKPPRNPVMTSSLHCGGSSGWAPKNASASPTR